ncbi:MAG: FGGY family carbohydrate kinase [Actinomycetota bacterium]
MTVVLAVDVGTTAVKAACVVDGAIDDVAEVPLGRSTPRPGRSEQHPDDWWAAAVGAMRSVARDDVDAISVTGQMQDLVPLRADGRPVRPAILYGDARAGAEHEELVDRFGPAWVDAVCGPLDATNLAAKWVWLQRHEPDVVEATDFVLLGAHSVVVQRLCGAVLCDPTTAATTGLFDVRSGVWWAPVVEELGIPVPPLGDPSTPAGWLATAVAAALELPAAVPVFHANGDAVATTLALVGDGGRRPYASIGTSGWVADVADRPLGGALSLPVGDGRFVSIAPMLTAGAAIDWAREAILGGIGPNALDRLADGVSAVEHGVLFVPHLDGVRFPVSSSEATGVLVGLRRSTGADVVAAAVLEGVAHALGQLLDLIAPDAVELAACGGAVRIDAVLRALADVCGIPVVRVDDAHAGLLGAAIVAHRGMGAEPLGAAAVTDRFEPDPRRHELHLRARPRFEAVVSSLGPVFGDLAALRAGADDA